MNIRIARPLQGGCIEAIPSKSQAHRLLIGAALAGAPTRVDCSAPSQDIEVTADCLRSLGAAVEYDGSGFQVEPIRQVRRGQTLQCRESGSTLRFLLPVAGVLGADCRFLMEGRLPQRPQEALLAVLAAHGCTVSKPAPGCIELCGQLRGGNFEIPGNISSQFISGLLMALPVLDSGSRLTVSGSMQSRPYIDMTLEMLRRFQIPVKEEEGRFSIAGEARYTTPGRVSAEGDWSNAAFWLCAGAICLQPICCKGLELSSYQGDKAILSLLNRMGADVQQADGALCISPSPLRGVEIDASDIPDLVPVLAAVAALAQGTTRIYNAQRLRLKESDRLRAVTDALSALGADIREEPDGLLIEGKPRLKSGIVDSCGDHRIAMMAAVAAAGCEGPVTVLGAQAVQKSYPAFWQHYRLLGGQAEEC